MENFRENLIPLFKNNGGVVSPMNTESCRRFLQEKANCKVNTKLTKNGMNL